MTGPALAQVPVGALTWELARLVGLAGAAAATAAVGALLYRWYVREALPRGLGAVLGVGTVAVYLNTVGLFQQVLDPAATASPFALPAVVANTTALGGGVLAAGVGRWVGDRVAVSAFGVVGASVPAPGTVGRLRDRLGAVTAVELPPEEEIADIAGYDPVSAATKERLGGRVVALPRGRDAVADRLVAHLRETYDIGRADVDVEGGRVTYLALGTRPAGIAPTLPPGTVAVPVRADPPNGAGPGDVVQVWAVEAPDTVTDADPEGAGTGGAGPSAGDDAGASAADGTDGAGASAADGTDDAGTSAADGADGGGAPEPELVLTAELRAAAGDVVTLAVEEAEAGALSAGRRYRLATAPSRAGVERSFASMLSAAEERMDAVTVAEGSPLVGATVGDLGGAVAAVGTPDGAVDPIPPRDRPLSAGETVYLIAVPAVLRRLSERARPG